MNPMTPMEPMEPMEPQAQWWPNGLSKPTATGSQNDLRYAYFSESRRLVIQTGGTTTPYDTGDHRISGVSQRREPEKGHKPSLYPWSILLRIAVRINELGGGHRRRFAGRSVE